MSSFAVKRVRFQNGERISLLMRADAIAVMRTNEVHGSRANYRCMFSTVDYNTIATHLGSIKDGRETIFSRHEFTEDDGSAMALRSQPPRHDVLLKSLAIYRLPLA
jgi:hypothetical protein